MNYSRIHNNIIQNAKTHQRKRDINYYENHHIIPTCLGGLNSKDNMILLTAREHYLVHWLLVKIYSNHSLCYKLASAFNKMCSRSSNQQRKYTSAQYVIARNNFSKYHPAKHNDIKKKISNSLKIYYENNSKYDYSKHVIFTCACGKKLNISHLDRRKFCSIECFNKFRTTEELLLTNEKRSLTLKKTLSQLTVEEQKNRIKQSFNNCDHVKRGKNISLSKKGKTTNQQEIVGKKYATMNNYDFNIFLSTKTSNKNIVIRMKKLRDRYLNV